MQHIISVNHHRFVQYVDNGGIATTDSSNEATVFQGEELLAALSMAVWHQPQAVITVLPKQ